MKRKNKFNMLVASSAVALLPLTNILAATSKSAREPFLWPTIEAGYGLLSVDVDAKDEINKKGNSIRGTAIANMRAGNWWYGFGLGMVQQQASDTNHSRGVKQTFDVSAPHIHIHGLYDLGKGWTVGVLTQGVYGKGAGFNAWNPKKEEMSVYVGPRVEWYTQGETLRFHVFAQGLSTIRNSDRNIRIYEGGAGLALILDRETETTPARKVEKEKPTPKVAAKAELKAEPTKIMLSTKLVSFDLNSTKLRPKSLEFLQKFGAILARYKEAWKNLSISGHTDSTGRKTHNEFLSKGRADSVLQTFIAQGVPAESLQAAGYADSKLLPGLPSAAPDHRRVELEFGDLSDDASAAEMVKQLNSLIAGYQST